ncbi:terpenoid synthase [Obba rivulosa]|uniref:Terpenoid synthase n=1 Tax=Obba rivulosa TaxID=1052685 RepID=A0A8E2ASR2_9APHY|nr:terpenoid synthase [Obba rivulosa]
MPTAVTPVEPERLSRRTQLVTPSSVDVSSIEEQISVAQISNAAISGFLGRLDITVPPFERDLKLEQRVDEIMQSWNCPPCPRPYVVTAIDITAMAYKHVQDFEAKAIIVIFTALAITLDDPEILAHLSSENFCLDVATGRIHEDDGWLAEYAKILSGMWTHFPRFSASTIFASGIDFVNGCILENTYHEPVVSASFVEYRRNKTGICDAYASFIWEAAQFPDEKEYVQAIPEAAAYCNYVNDIMSFYKEELAGETGTYLQDRAKVSGKSPLAALYDLIDDTVAIVERARATLGEGRARKSWEAFVSGYISFHVHSPRYRLAEIIDRKYMTP